MRSSKGFRCHELAVGVEIALRQAGSGHIQLEHHLRARPPGIDINQTSRIGSLHDRELQGIPSGRNPGARRQRLAHIKAGKARIVAAQHAEIAHLVFGLRRADDTQRHHGPHILERASHGGFEIRLGSPGQQCTGGLQRQRSHGGGTAEADAAAAEQCCQVSLRGRGDGTWASSGRTGHQHSALPIALSKPEANARGISQHR